MTMPTASAALVIRGLSEAQQHVGQELGVSPWHTVTQADIDAFAALTRDHHWIHIDQQRAERGPMGGTIAHGLYTLSLAPKLMSQIVEWGDLGTMLNYGYERVRFPAPLPVGSSVRMRMTLLSATEAPGGAQLVLDQLFEREGSDRPVCVARFLLRFVEEHHATSR
jgi:acyl dehydratase